MTYTMYDGCVIRLTNPVIWVSCQADHAIKSTFAGEEQWWIQCRQNENQIISSKRSYHAEGNVKVCMRIYNEWELCRVPSISFHRLHL